MFAGLRGRPGDTFGVQRCGHVCLCQDALASGWFAQLPCVECSTQHFILVAGSGMGELLWWPCVVRAALGPGAALAMSAAQAGESAVHAGAAEHGGICPSARYPVEVRAIVMILFVRSWHESGVKWP